MCCKRSFVSNTLDDLSEGPKRQIFEREEPNEQETEGPKESKGQKLNILHSNL